MCKTSKFKVSDISNMKDNMGVAWVTCPLQLAVRIAENGVMTLGWTRVKIELLRKRPVQCFQCWHFGHARSNCRSEISRKGSCFRCGQTDHLASTCKVARPKCLICEEIGKEYRHRIGSQRCLKNRIPWGCSVN